MDHSRHNQDVVCGPYRGSIRMGLDSEPLREALSEVASWVRGSDQVLGHGRNLIVRTTQEVGGQTYDFVVKSFGRQTRIKQVFDRRLGTKAERAFDAACHLIDSGVGTPFPVAHLARWKGSELMESYLITEYEPDTTDLRRVLIERYVDQGPSEAIMEVLQRVADAVRTMHDGGLQHGDLGNQNILLLDYPEPDVLFIDLNRARVRSALDAAARGRDISRLHLADDLLRIFKEMYWRGIPPLDFERAEHRARRNFWFHTVTRRIRHPIRERKTIRPVVDYPADRDIWIWDNKSGQAIPVFSGKKRRALMSRRSVLCQIKSVLLHGPAIYRHYHTLLRNAYGQPISMHNRVGLCLEPSAHGVKRRIELVHELGKVPVHLRFYHHQGHKQIDENLFVARQLHEAGHPVSVALVQDRQAVLQPEEWATFCDAVVSGLSDFVSFVEIGHAVNRVKWGLWGLEDWQRLIANLPALQAKYPTVEFTGPAGIDFEYPFVLAALDNLPKKTRIAALSHHLYVDRRGAPESRQGPFSTLEKCALARAVARHHDACGDRFICSEVNWPLLGTGVYSPVGSPYLYPGQMVGFPSVSEKDYAAYLLRYLLITLCSGFVDQVLWWRLAAHGYGLVDDLDLDPQQWRLRSGFHVLKFLIEQCGNSTFVLRECKEDGSIWFKFKRDSDVNVWVGYRCEGKAWAELPCTAATLFDAFGESAGVVSHQIELSGLPVYLVEVPCVS